MRGPARLILIGVVALVVVAGGGYALLAARGDDAPPPVSLGQAPTTAGQAGTDDGAGAATADGTWRVRSGDGTFVGYRIREQLAFLSAPNDAVGRTTAVTGTMRIAGQRVESARVEADLTQLRSNESRRDNAIRQRGLESDSFPTATFELTEPIALDQAPAPGQAIAGQARGKLTIRDTTREVTWGLKGRWDGDTVRVTGSLPVRLPDYGVQPPRFGPVVSIQDTATVELQLTFERA
jgi:polyisoprenoid-binding protein YceI